ncbi:MAG: M48 family metallopeptidase [Planctomycetota bacterium]|nr:M48 family metallopeptidase [Planctomycetota bacterium]
MAVQGPSDVLRCRNCGQQLRVPDLGKELHITCPRCNHQFTHDQASATRSRGAGAPSAKFSRLSAAGEQTAMWFGIGAVALTMLLLAYIGTWLLLPILVAFTAIVVWVQQSQLIGGAVKVSPSQFPEINAAAELAAARLDMKRPDIFVHFSPVLNAAAIGCFGKKSVVLHSALVEAMSPKELLTIIGHEFTHIKCGHTTLLVLLNPAAGIGIPVISHILQFVFRWWSRKAEYTADRGGLLASRDPTSVLSAFCKLAVGPELFKKMMIMDFIEQAGDLDRSRLAKLSETLMTHPYLVRRVHGIREFYASEAYRDLVAYRS